MREPRKSGGTIVVLASFVVASSIGVASGAICGGTTACSCGDTLVGTRTLDTDPVVSTGPGDVCGTAVGLKLADGATLLGAGKTIRAAGNSNGGSAGVSFIGCGATAQNLTVEGFGNGFLVEDRDCRDGTVCNATSTVRKPNTIQAVTAKNNGSSTAHEGYGIKINDSQCVTVKGVSVVGAADEGIHLGHSHRITMAVLPNPYCGPRKVAIQDSFRENLYLLDSTNNTFSDIVSAYPAGGCATAGRQCIGAHIEGGNESGTGATSSANTMTASQFSDFGIKLTGDADGNTFGAAGAGLEVQTVRFEFESRRDGNRRPNGNTLANVTVDGTGNECVVFSTAGSGPTTNHPFGNTGSGTLIDCGPEVDTSGTTRDMQPTNNLCGFSCADGECNETESGNDSGIGDPGVAKFRRAGGEFECP